MATESLPNDASNNVDDAKALADDTLDSAGILAQRGITKGVRGLISGVRSVLNPSATEQDRAVRDSMLRQAAANQGTRLASQGVQAVLYGIGGIPGVIYKGLRLVAGDKGALLILFGGIGLCFLCMLVVIQQGIELTNNPGELIKLGIECRLSGKSDAECAVQGLKTKTSEFAKSNTCDAAAERVGKTVECDGLGVSDD